LNACRRQRLFQVHGVHVGVYQDRAGLAAIFGGQVRTSRCHTGLACASLAENDYLL